MRSWVRPVFAAAFLLLSAAAASFGSDPDRTSRLLEESHRRVARLEALAGRASFRYSGPAGRERAHRMRFYFKKPFRVLIDEIQGSFRFSTFDGRVQLYFPREHELLRFDSGGAQAELLRRFIELVRFENFASGFGLDEVRNHFAIAVRNEDAKIDPVVVLTPLEESAWRAVLKIDRLEVTIDRTSALPRLVEAYSRPNPLEPPRLGFAMTIEEVTINPPLKDVIFTATHPADARLLGVGDVVGVVLEMCSSLGRETLDGLGSRVMKSLQKALERPWDR